MYSSRVFGEKGLGTAMGLMTLVFLVIGSLGPPVAGVLSESTGSRLIPVLGAAGVVAAAALVLRDKSRD
jgi:MFS family permease